MILIVAPNVSGVTYHRLIVPFTNLDSQVQTTQSIVGATDEELKPFKVIVFSRTIAERYEYIEAIVPQLKRLGIKIVVDVDDYWHYSKKHLFYKEHIADQVPEKCILSMAVADYVIASTPYLADKVKDINKNVLVCENALGTKEAQWQPKKIESNKMRFGWFGSLCHQEDIELMRFGISKLHGARDLYNKYQLVLGGWTLDFNMSWIYEEIFTDKYKAIRGDKDLLAWLRTVDGKPCPYNNKVYKRIYGTGVKEYGKGYNEIDVALTPLASNEFNRCKSELKAIEAGFMKKALIVSNVMPYIYICNDKNSMLCETKLDWYIWMRKCILNPNMVEDYANQLHEDTKKYNIDSINVKRKQLIDRLVE